MKYQPVQSFVANVPLVFIVHLGQIPQQIRR